MKLLNRCYSFIAVATMIALLSTGCSKDTTSNPSGSSKIDLSTMQTPGGAGTTYHSYQCPADEGNGCYCAISPNDEDCERQTDCTSDGLTNYSAVLNANYTQAEIDFMESTNAPITDPALKQALYDDGFPIILE